MNNGKRRITVKIAGNTLPLITDEPAESVTRMAAELNERIAGIKRKNFRISTQDALILCAMDDGCEKTKLQQRVLSLESQAELYELTIENLQEEIAALRQEAAGESEASTLDDYLKKVGGDGEEYAPEDKVRAIEKYLENKKAAPGENTEEARLENIRYIESLLLGNGGKAK